MYNLTGIAETLMLPLYLRARESQRPDGIIQDQTSIEVVRQLDYDFTWLESLPNLKSSQVAAAIRTEIFDEVTGGFLRRHPADNIVNLGAGLCTRFNRLDNGQACWYELDFETVIEVRRRLLPDSDRHQSLPGSVLDFAWCNHVPADRPTLFIGEGILYYLPLLDVQQLLTFISDHFLHSELVFDACGPRLIKSINRGQLSQRFNTVVHWGVTDFHKVEQWCSRLRFVQAWNYVDRHTNRWGMMGLIKWIPPLKQQLWRIAHFISY